MDSKPFPLLILAPMEGVTDAPMRALLTSLGGVDFCVSEFLRISENVPPARVFARYVPESASGWRTASGTPVIPQLLGGNALKLAEAAEVLIRMGASAVDLNFGCPAKTVNRHDGGATLLQYPERIFEIVRAVRDRAAGRVPVTAKIRLGWDCAGDVYRIAETVERAGADRLTVHARTKTDGYTGKAKWEFLKELRQRLAVPLVANGDITNAEEFRSCLEFTGCDAFMIGRGAVRDPYLFRRIRGLEVTEDLPGLVERFVDLAARDARLRGYEAGRVKQFIRFLADRSPEMGRFFEHVKPLQTAAAIASALPGFFTPRTSPPKCPGVSRSASQLLS